MSAPQALRIAIEACRPKKPSVIRLRSCAQRRWFGPTHAAARIDITKGFPMPKPDAAKGAEGNSEKEESLETEPGATSEQLTTPVSTQVSPEQGAPARDSEDNSLLSDGPAQEPSEQTPPAAATSIPDDQNMSDPRSSQPASTLSNAPQEATDPPESNTADPQDAQPPEPKPIPPNVLAAYRVPLKHRPTHALPVASLQLRSYSVRELEFFTDFCMRAAFYLNIPARTNPLPNRTERWTTIRSNFVHKKSQENFERVTHKRMITLMDAEKSVVETWLAFVRKWQFYGVGMKANVWEWEGLHVAERMDKVGEEEVVSEVTEKLGEFGWNKTVASEVGLDRLIRAQGKEAVGVGMMSVREASLSEDGRRKVRGMEEKRVVA